MTTKAVRIEADMAFVHEGRSVIRGDRLDTTRENALDLQALAIAHIVVEEESPESSGVEVSGEQPEPRPARTGSKNRYLRRERRDGDA